MVLRIGQEICHEGVRYRVEGQIASSNGYREEYVATELGAVELNSTELGAAELGTQFEDASEQGVGNPTRVRLIVYSMETVEGLDVRQMADSERGLSLGLRGAVFERCHGSFDAVTDDGKAVAVIVTDFVEAESLRSSVERRDICADEALRAFADLAAGLKEISQLANGASHFGMNPDNIFVYRDADKGLHTLLRGLNLVCGDYEKNGNLDKSLVLPEYRAPETHMRPFTPRSAQWSLALLLTYLFQESHPWGLTPTASPYAAYSRIRRNKPDIRIDGDLGKVLRKALSVDPSRRYGETDDFIKEVSAAVDLPTLCRNLDMPAPDLPSQSSPSAENAMPRNEAPTPAPSRTEERESRSEPKLEMGREPKSAVKMERVKGEGFSAVAGMNELKSELRRDFIDVIANSKLASQYGILPPGMLFYGPPGCGKTYLAEHLGQELGIDFSVVNPSDLGSIYIHGSQKMIADLFAKAEKKAKKNGQGVLLIFDELESMVPSRKSENNENQAGEVAEFLTRLNNSSQRGVYVIGLTNCLDKIDKAVLRKGRFDKVVYIDLPDFDARKALFDFELSKRPRTKDIDMDRLGVLTDGYTSSDITYIVAESAREMFAATLRSKSAEALNITQNVLEDVIAKTRPSVTKADLRHYEEMRDRYATGDKRQRPAVGFNAG